MVLKLNLVPKTDTYSSLKTESSTLNWFLLWSWNLIYYLKLVLILVLIFNLVLKSVTQSSLKT